MFKRLHHQRVATVLHAFNRDLLQEAECYFGGGTAIVLSLDEYRESVDIDFLCASNDGYRLLRNTVSQDLGQLLTEPLKHLREVRADRYGIRTVLEVDGIPIKVEMVSKGRIAIEGEVDPVFQVPTLSRADMYAEKLLANADRGRDKSVMSRDIIDLAMMIDRWGQIPALSWMKVYVAYGAHVIKEFYRSTEMVHDAPYLSSCLHKMQMNADLISHIPAVLEAATTNIPLGIDK